MKIAIIGTMPEKGYSGGRMHAWMMGEALAHNGNTVYMIVNNIPAFSVDFSSYPSHEQIKIVLTNDFYDIEINNPQFDYVICIPGIAMGERFYWACLDFAVKSGAIFSFINFETPNWYETYTKMARPLEDYELLRELCRYGCLIFSSANESQKYAKEYYNQYLATTEFQVWSPPINSIVADCVVQEKRLRQIMVFMRVADKHKGHEDFLQIMGEYLRGWTILIVAGAEIPDSFVSEASNLAKIYGIVLRFLHRINEKDKFREIKRSRILLFLSHFEGYGLPPVEALYCGTKCITYDLPVLREISGNHLVYCEIGNISDVQSKLISLMNDEDFPVVDVETANFEHQAEKLQRILVNNLQNNKLRLNWVQKLYKKWKVRFMRYRFLLAQEFFRELPDVVKYCLDNDINVSVRLQMENETWTKVREDIKDKQVYIWGSGRAYREIIPAYKKKLQVYGIVDSSRDKQGKRDQFYKNLFIQSPATLKEIDREHVAVIIATKEHIDDIIGCLEGMGIKTYHSLCMMEMNSARARKYKAFFAK